MRDPTIDPRPGDIVRSAKNLRERHVYRREGHNIYYQAVIGLKTSELKLCWITTWQDWCRTNAVEVVQLG